MAVIRLEVEVAHPPQCVWRALTDARLLSSWLMATDFYPQAGTAFTLHPTDLTGLPEPISGELVEVTEPHRIVMVWQAEQLHTRVTWELTATPGGTTLHITQTGFIGPRAAMRRHELLATYRMLFSQRLPQLLDRLARGQPSHAPAPHRPDPAPGSPAAAVPVLPSWVRFAAIGATTAVLAVTGLAALSSAAEPEPVGVPPLGEARPGLGQGVQPGETPSWPPTGADGAGFPPASAAGSPSHAHPSGSPPRAPDATPSRSAEDAAEPPDDPPTAPGSPPAASPKLAATMSTSTSGLPLLGLGGLEVTVVVSNSGPADADGWEVVMDVGNQQVRGVSGAHHEQAGSVARFTALGTGPAAGQTASFTFHLPHPLLLGSARAPSSCTIDGQPCG